MALFTRTRSIWLLSSLAVAVLLGALGFAGIAWTIGSGVRAAGGAAQQEFGGDRVTALIAYADSPDHSFPDRNRAVWALGQLGDRRALPFLESHYTGGPCDHSRMLCQRELDKAIRLCRGSTNAPALLWRHALILNRGT